MYYAWFHLLWQYTKRCGRKKVCSETEDNIVKMELSNLKIALSEHEAMNKMKHSQRQAFIIADQLAQEKKNTFVSD